MSFATLSKTAESLQAEARELTGIDIADNDIEEALTILVQSLNTEAQLSAEGVAGMERFLRRVLCNRLRMLRDIQNHPEILEQPVDRPLIVCGGPRTGTTKLHKLLAATGEFRYLPFWQGFSLSLRTGNRDESPEPRIRDADEFIEWIFGRSPEARFTHEFKTQEPEEENLILDHALYAVYLSAFVMIPGYIQWSLENGFDAQFRFMKTGLQYLQWQFDDGKPVRRWILKSPGYPGMEPVLKQVFPDADFATTHRNPLDSVVSAASTSAALHRVYSDEDRRLLMGQMALQGFSACLINQMQIRDRNPDISVMDISYGALMEEPQKVVRDILVEIDLPYTEDTESRIQQWLSTAVDKHHAGHRYSADEFGLNSELIQAQFSNYIERYKAFF